MSRVDPGAGGGAAAGIALVARLVVAWAAITALVVALGVIGWGLT